MPSAPFPGRHVQHQRPGVTTGLQQCVRQPRTRGTVRVGRVLCACLQEGRKTRHARDRRRRRAARGRAARGRAARHCSATRSTRPRVPSRYAAGTLVSLQLVPQGPCFARAPGCSRHRRAAPPHAGYLANATGTPDCARGRAAGTRAAGPRCVASTPSTGPAASSSL